MQVFKTLIANQREGCQDICGSMQRGVTKSNRLGECCETATLILLSRRIIHSLDRIPPQEMVLQAELSVGSAFSCRQPLRSRKGERSQHFLSSEERQSQLAENVVAARMDQNDRLMSVCVQWFYETDTIEPQFPLAQTYMSRLSHRNPSTVSMRAWKHKTYGCFAQDALWHSGLQGRTDNGSHGTQCKLWSPQQPLKQISLNLASANLALRIHKAVVEVRQTPVAAKFFGQFSTTAMRTKDKQ